MNNRFESLDGVRGTLALFVMLSHIIGSYGGWSSDRAFIGAHLCVLFFFIMSGFVLSHSNSSKSLIKYSLLRFSRLWPLMFVSTMLMLAIYYYNSKTNGYVSSYDVFNIDVIIKNLLFLYGVWSEKFILLNEPSWSISLEFWVSLIIPLFFIKFSKIKKLVVISLIFIFLLINNKNTLPGTILTASLCMLSGSLVYDFFKSTVIKEKDFGIFVTFSLLCCLIGCYFLDNGPADYILFILFLPCLFLDKFDNSLLINKILRSNFFQFFGRISFPLYLLHEVVIVSRIIPAKYGQYPSVIMVSLICICIAYLYTIYIDEPLYSKLKNKIKSI